MLLSDICLSVAYIGPKSRTERPRKTKIGTEGGHVTCGWDTTFKVKRSKVKVTRPLWLAVYWQANMNVELVTDPDVCIMYIVSPVAGLVGGIVAASRLQLV